MLRARDLKESAKRESERELKDSQKTAKETDGYQTAERHETFQETYSGPIPDNNTTSKGALQSQETAFEETKSPGVDSELNFSTRDTWTTSTDAALLHLYCLCQDSQQLHHPAKQLISCREIGP